MAFLDYTGLQRFKTKLDEQTNHTINDIKDAINVTEPKIKQLTSTFEVGTLDNSGQPSTASNRYRTVNYIPVNPSFVHYLSVGEGGRAYVYQYDKDKNYMSGKAIGWISQGTAPVSLDSACYFIKLVISASNGNLGSEYLPLTFFVLEINPLSDSNAVPPLSVQYGTIYDATTIFNANFKNTRAYSNFIPVQKSAVKVTLPDNTKAYLWQYTKDFQFIREDGWAVGGWLKGLESNAAYLVITFAPLSSGTLTLSNLLSTTVEFIDVDRFAPNDNLNGFALWAHRGAASAPENTIPAIELAIEQGYKAIEVDIEFTSDNVCVLLHDKTIDRTSDGTGNIYDMTYEQALEYDFGSWKGEEYAGTNIPTLEEALLACKKHHVVMQLDVADTSKTNITYANIQEMCEVIKKTGMEKSVTVCAYHERLRQVLAALPGVCVTFGLNSLANAKFTDLGSLSSLPTFSSNKSSITTNNAKYFHDLGYLVQSWEIDTAEDFSTYYEDYYVDWIITNSLLPTDI